MREVDESYQPVEQEREINSPAVRTVTIVGAAALVVTIALLWWTRSGRE